MVDERKTTLIDWDSDISGAGRKVPVSPVVADALSCMAARMAACHINATTVKPKGLLHGLGFSIAARMRDDDPAQWRRWMGCAIDCITALHGSGEKDLAHVGVKDGASYFTALAEFANHLRGN